VDDPHFLSSFGQPFVEKSAIPRLPEFLPGSENDIGKPACNHGCSGFFIPGPGPGIVFALISGNGLKKRVTKHKGGTP
jgi:hypothetical protein